MKIDELITSEICRLPRPRGEYSFYDALVEALDRYQEALGRIATDSVAAERLRSRLGEIAAICSTLTLTLRSYLEGCHNRAYRQFAECVDESAGLRSYTALLTSDTPLMRGRTGDALSELRADIANRDGIFHVPFTHLENVSRQRYGLPGVPSLFLCSSAYVSWVELSRPPMSSWWLACFSVRKGQSLKVLDISRYWPEDLFLEIQQHAKRREGGSSSVFNDEGVADRCEKFFVLWPILAALGFRVKHEEAHFVPEYIFSHLFMLWLRQQEDLHGLKYRSSKIGAGVMNNEMVANYAFPARFTPGEKFCPELRSWFDLSLPYVAENLLHHRGWNGDADSNLPDYHRDLFPEYPEGQPATAYGTTIFGKLEKILLTAPRKPVAQ